MGVDFAEKPKKGPGKKVKKQGAPPTISNLKVKPDENTKLSSRQKKRLKNRVEKKNERRVPLKPSSDDDEEQESHSGSDEDLETKGNNGFTDDNNEWLKPKGKNLLDDEDDDLEDDV